MRRASYVFLCVAPLLFILTAFRALRIPGWHQAIGGILCAAILGAAWQLGGRSIRADAARAGLALAGGLFVVSFGLGSLFFVGLGPPWEATPEENRTRYLALLLMSIAVTSGFVALKEVIRESGERFHSTLGFAAAWIAGPLYVVWMIFSLGAFAVKARTGRFPSGLDSLDEVLDILLFVAGATTYLATAAYAAALGRVHWLGRWPARAYVAANLLALLCLSARGLEFPDPAASSTPWYVQPGFVAGIPAVPFIMPFWLGVVLLRRAGDEDGGTGSPTTRS